MLYQPRVTEKIPRTITLLLLISIGACLLTAVQVLLIASQGDVLCLNEGCEIVEKLTTVPPIVFNIAGSVYFFILCLAFRQGGRGGRGWLSCARLLLLAGMAAEGVLIGFQQYVAEIYCSYCLIIFSLILILNLLMGWRQIFAAAAVFGGVSIAFYSLEFSSRSETEPVELQRGVFGHLEGPQASSELFLFFSSSCPHCEEVIETLDQEFSCNLNFSPIDTLDKFSPAGMVRSNEYSPAVNRKFLTNMGISEIPVLLSRMDGEIRLLKGKQLIKEYLDKNCRGEKSLMPEESTSIREQRPALPYFLPTPQDDSCTVEEACVEVPSKPEGE